MPSDGAITNQTCLNISFEKGVDNIDNQGEEDVFALRLELISARNQYESERRQVKGMRQSYEERIRELQGRLSTRDKQIMLVQHHLKGKAEEYEENIHALQEEIGEGKKIIAAKDRQIIELNSMVSHEHLQYVRCIAAHNQYIQMHNQQQQECSRGIQQLKQGLIACQSTVEDYRNSIASFIQSIQRGIADGDGNDTQIHTSLEEIAQKLIRRWEEEKEGKQAMERMRLQFMDKEREYHNKLMQLQAQIEVATQENAFLKERHQKNTQFALTIKQNIIKSTQNKIEMKQKEKEKEKKLVPIAIPSIPSIPSHNIATHHVSNNIASNNTALNSVANTINNSINQHHVSIRKSFQTIQSIESTLRGRENVTIRQRRRQPRRTMSEAKIVQYRKQPQLYQPYPQPQLSMQQELMHRQRSLVYIMHPAQAIINSKQQQEKEQYDKPQRRGSLPLIDHCSIKDSISRKCKQIIQ